MNLIKVWFNHNAKKSPISLLVGQTIERPNTNNGGALLRKMFNIGKSRSTSILAMPAEFFDQHFAPKLKIDSATLETMTEPFYLIEEEAEMETRDRQGVDFTDVFTEAFGEPAGIQVRESINPPADELGWQEKVNPETSEVLAVAGNPIFRRTDVVAMSELKHEFVQHDELKVSTSVPAGDLVAAEED
jgi:hypothetical protein